MKKNQNHGKAGEENSKPLVHKTFELNQSSPAPIYDPGLIIGFLLGILIILVFSLFVDHELRIILLSYCAGVLIVCMMLIISGGRE